VTEWLVQLGCFNLADSINSFKKSRLDKYWTNPGVIYNYNCDLTGTGGLPVCM